MTPNTRTLYNHTSSSIGCTLLTYTYSKFIKMTQLSSAYSSYNLKIHPERFSICQALSETLGWQVYPAKFDTLHFFSSHLIHLQIHHICKFPVYLSNPCRQILGNSIFCQPRLQDSVSLSPKHFILFACVVKCAYYRSWLYSSGILATICTTQLFWLLF